MKHVRLLCPHMPTLYNFTRSVAQIAISVCFLRTVVNVFGFSAALKASRCFLGLLCERQKKNQRHKHQIHQCKMEDNGTEVDRIRGGAEALHSPAAGPWLHIQRQTATQQGRAALWGTAYQSPRRQREGVGHNVHQLNKLHRQDAAAPQACSVLSAFHSQGREVARGKFHLCGI